MPGIFREVVPMVGPQWNFLFRRRKHNMVSNVSFIYLIDYGVEDKCVDIYYSNHYIGKF